MLSGCAELQQLAKIMYTENLPWKNTVDPCEDMLLLFKMKLCLRQSHWNFPTILLKFFPVFHFGGRNDCWQQNTWFQAFHHSFTIQRSKLVLLFSVYSFKLPVSIPPTPSSNCSVQKLINYMDCWSKTDRSTHFSQGEKSISWTPGWLNRWIWMNFSPPHRAMPFWWNVAK